jgi:hypothetical protein
LFKGLVTGRSDSSPDPGKQAAETPGKVTSALSARCFPSKPDVWRSIYERLQFTKRRFFFSPNLHPKTIGFAPASGHDQVCTGPGKRW